MDYLRENGMTFLQMPCSNGDYTVQMLMHNRIRGLVQARYSSLDNKDTLLYPVSGKQTLSHWLSIGSFSGEEIRMVVGSLIQVLENLDQFLLPLEGLVLKSDYIYTRRGSLSEIEWIYQTADEETGDVRQLVESLLDHINFSDPDAVRFSYGVFQRIRDAGEDGLGYLLNEGKAMMDEFPAVEEEHVVMMQPSTSRQNQGKERIAAVPQIVADKREEKPEQSNRRNTRSVMHSLKEAWRILTTTELGVKKAERQAVVAEKSPAFDAAPVVTAYSLTTAAIPAFEEEMTICDASPVGQEKQPVLLTESGEVIPITEYPFYLGKAVEDGYVIDDATVSRYHACIDEEDHILFLTDLNSTNGTTLNGVSLTPYLRMRLADGDRIRLSRREFRFSWRKSS